MYPYTCCLRVQARRPAGGGSGGSGTAGAKAAMGAGSAQLPESASPERTGAQVRPSPADRVF